MDSSTRIYPLVCQSAYCGKIDCTGCEHLPQLEEFKKWVKDNNAEVADPIWSRTIYVRKGKND